MRLGREATAARQRASRLAGLAGRCPAPNTAPQGAGLLVGHAIGRGFTAVAQQVPRLAGLVWLPAGCIAQTAIRRQVSWLTTKASVNWISRWPFTLQKSPGRAGISPIRGETAQRRLRARNPAFSSFEKSFALQIMLHNSIVRISSSRVLFCCPFFSYVLYLNIEKEMSGKLPAGISFPKACTFEKICYNIFCSCRSDGMADVTDSKSVGSDTVRVQVPPSAPWRVLLQRLKGC